MLFIIVQRLLMKDYLCFSYYENAKNNYLASVSKFFTAAKNNIYSPKRIFFTVLQWLDMKMT